MHTDPVIENLRRAAAADPAGTWLDPALGADDAGESGIPTLIKIVGFAAIAVLIVTGATAIAQGWLGIIPQAGE